MLPWQAGPPAEDDGYDRYGAEYVKRQPDREHIGQGGAINTSIADYDREYERLTRRNPVRVHVMDRTGLQAVRSVDLDPREFSAEAMKYAFERASDATRRSSSPGAQVRRAEIVFETLRELKNMQQPSYGYAGNQPAANYPPGPPPGPQPYYVQQAAQAPIQALPPQPPAYQVVPGPGPQGPAPQFMPAPPGFPPPTPQGPAPQFTPAPAGFPPAAPAPRPAPQPPREQVNFFVEGAGQFSAPYHWVNVQYNSGGEPVALYLTLDNAYEGAMRYLPGTLGKGVVQLAGSPLYLYVEGVGLQFDFKAPDRGLDLTTAILLVTATQPIGGASGGEAR